MNKKKIVIIGIIYSFLVVFSLTNTYVNMEYNLNVFEYIKKSLPFTEEEKKWLEKHKNLIYSSDQSSPPFRYKGKEDGQYKGIIVDLINSLSIQIGRDFYFKPNNWWKESFVNSIDDSIKFFDLIPSKERANKFIFTDPIYTLSANILKDKKSQDINSYMDLKGKTVAIPEGDYSINFLKQKIQDINILLTPDIKTGVNHLMSGKVDAVVGDEPVLRYYINNYGLSNKYSVLSNPIYTKKAVLAVPKQYEELVSILNKGIFKLQKNGVYKDLKKKWYSTYNEVDDILYERGIVPSIYLFIGIILISIYVFYSYTYLLKIEIKRKTEQVIENKKTLEATFNSITDIIMLVDENNNIVESNKVLYDFMGEMSYKIADLISMIKGVIENTFSENTNKTSEIEIHNKILKINTFPVEYKKNNTEYIVVLIKDITNDKIVEAKLLRENKMISIGQLASGVAHEIRNPLGIIRNNCYLLKDNVTMEEVNDCVKSIESNVDRASNIITNLLNFARISDDNLEHINIRNFIENIVKLQYKMLQLKNVEIKIDCEHNLICYINGESLKHVFINLISNSIDAIHQDGKIIIYCYEKNHCLFIDFKDNGEGIKEDALKDIFNPFYTTKPIGEGTGLGLYITYNEIKKNNGDISVESKLGVGTCFHIKIPLNKEVTI
ncbi:his Kinase A domain protein [Clostridioides difficile 824]|uniref:ATP-binding protein n=1 Tax=Clostridioides difficile TaxID=1496 RepID=UPI00038D7AA2|nr:transporter substrate-binding domain-containing protein [Clostridioides difficile]OFU40255.1 histidine kinase [Clostridium sp. HMSC19A11]AXU60892.1 two-component sensor histidine kinase [Clostridioides difficile]EGT4721332.1 histidine kinase [Clostridioides difficile]EQE62498.1 his Kinase A domain protein [Clostridioides difficile CD44]EQF91495.1 his Kinase A domain protein [Clostridioides difficile 824]